MSFLNPALLSLLLPLLALPLAIHLLNRHFPQLFRFSSIERIKETMARRSRLHRWRHLILLILRTALLLLLLLAFLKPILPRYNSQAGARGQRHVLIMIDHSLSMEHRGDGPTSRQRAVHEAESLLATLAADDLVNIVLIQQSPATCFVEFSRNHAEAKRFLNSLKPGLTRGDVNQANALAASLLTKVKTRVDIFYISDFQRKNWSNGDFSALPAGARLFFVDAGAKHRDNGAVLDVQVNQAQILAGETVPLEITIGNFSDKRFQDRITVVLDRKLSFDQEVFIAPWTAGKFTLPVPVGSPGLHVCQVKLPADDLDLDNHFYMTLSAVEKEEVLIITDDPPEKKDTAWFIKTALNPYSDLRGSLLPRLLPGHDVTASRLAGVKKVVLTHVNQLPEEAIAALAKHLFQGTGILYFLDSPSDDANLAALEKAVGAGILPLQLTHWRSVPNAAAGAQQIVKGEFKSRYLKLFRGVARQDLGLVEVYDYWQARATGAGQVLLAYGDESPAMAVAGHGLGTLLLLNFSASEMSSNLARQRLFPAWVQELAKALSADEPPPMAYTIGQPLQTEVWKEDMRTADFLDPAGRAITVKRELQQDRYSIAFVPDQLGLYTLGAPALTAAFGVNASADEADLRPLEKEMLPTRLGEQQQGFVVAGRENYEELTMGRPVFHWFVLAALAVLLIENGFQMLVRRSKA